MNYRQQVPCEKCGATRPETRPLIVFPAGTVAKLRRPALWTLAMAMFTASGALLSHAAHIGGFGIEHGASVAGAFALFLGSLAVAGVS